MRRIFIFLGSVYFAVTLITLLSLTLIASTLLEAAHGTPFVQRFFYQAGWFDVFLSLIAVNMFISMMLRFPFKKHHTGFVITHIGILMLLVGSLLSRVLGVEGQMLLYESEKSNLIYHNTYEITVHRHSGEAVRFDLADLPGRDVHALDSVAKGLSMRVLRVLENARESVNIEEGDSDDPLNAAVRFRLKSATVGFDDAFWLVEKDLADPKSDRKLVGPAVFELHRESAAAVHKATPKVAIAEESSSPSVTITLGGETAVRVALDKPAPASMKLGDASEITNFVYYPSARVNEQNKLVNGGDKPDNPAVAFDLRDNKGNSMRQVFFALYPDFQSMHGQADAGPRVEAKFSIPNFPAHSHAAAASGADGPRLVVETNGREWTYRAVSKRGEESGAIGLGRPIVTGWMDFELAAEALYDRARVRRGVEPAPGKGFLAAELSFSSDGKEVWRGWVREEESVSLPLGQDIIVRVGSKAKTLPFELALKDFRKVDYPGTQSAKSYESDVVLTDTHEKIEIHKTIKMNEPLDYKGFRIFQSSFVSDPTHGEASVFTIAKNPGITLIYMGSIVLFSGVVLVFFVKPFSPWGKK